MSIRAKLGAPGIASPRVPPGGGGAALSNNNPVNVDNTAAAPGVSTEASRSDHHHDVNFGTPVSVGSANAAGSATTLALSDHVHDGTTILTASAPADVTKAAAAVGVATLAARADHKHDITTAVPVSVGSANAEGTATTLARSDHVHDGTTILTSSAPVGVTDTGTPAVGVATTAARADHQHGVANAEAGPPQNGVCYWLGPITFTAGGGGASDDIIYNANAPRKFRVVDMFVKVTTAVLNATMQLRDATGGVGNICASAISGAAAALVRNNNTNDRTIAAGGTLVIRRADNTTAGIMYILCMPEA